MNSLHVPMSQRRRLQHSARIGIWTNRRLMGGHSGRCWSSADRTAPAQCESLNDANCSLCTPLTSRVDAWTQQRVLRTCVTNKIAFENLFFFSFAQWLLSLPSPPRLTERLSFMITNSVRKWHDLCCCGCVFLSIFRFFLLFFLRSFGPSLHRLSPSVCQSCCRSIDRRLIRSFTMRKALREMKNVVYQFSPIELKVRRERESSDSDRRR